MHGSATSYFQQTPPDAGDVFTADKYLQDCIAFYVPSKAASQALVDDMCQYAAQMPSYRPLQAEANRDLPRLEQWGPFGTFDNRIVVSRAWSHDLHRIACEGGLIGLAYGPAATPLSRLQQMLRLLSFMTISATVTCPTSMTDGAARLIEQLRLTQDAHIGPLFKGFTSLDWSTFKTCGQWMTEKTGGSDLRDTSTIATPTSEPGVFRLNGLKFYTSATTADWAFLLAKVDGDESLSLFVTNVASHNGGLRVLKLKDKFGTKALPTAELLLVNQEARLVGERGRGVANISPLFNLTRIYTVTASISAMSHMLALIRDYAHKRVVFGKPLSQNALHLRTVSTLEVVRRGCLHMFLQLTLWLGDEERGNPANPSSSALLRFLTPVAKAFVSEHAVRLSISTVQSFGGAGYMNDSGIPEFISGTLVNTIWEGTAAVLGMDVARVCAHDGGASLRLCDALVRPHCSPVLLQRWEQVCAQLAKTPFAPAAMRDVLFNIGFVVCGALLARYASKTGSSDDAWVAREWQERVAPPSIAPTDAAHLASERNVALCISKL